MRNLHFFRFSVLGIFPAAGVLGVAGLAIVAAAQPSTAPPSTTPPATAPPPGGGAGRQGGGGGFGVNVDVGRLLGTVAAAARTEAVAAAPEWQNLNIVVSPFGDATFDRLGGVVLYDPGHRLVGDSSFGVRVDIPDVRVVRPRVTTEVFLSNPDTPAGRRIVTIPAVAGPRTIPADRICPPPVGFPVTIPCPEREELLRIRAELARLQRERDDLARDNALLRPQLAAANDTCAAQRRDCEERLALAQAEVDRARMERDMAQAAAAAAQAELAASKGPGQNAGAVYFPMGVTHSGNREIEHEGWDVIRLYVDDNRITVGNDVENYIRQHPELPAEQIAWLRANYGTIPTGSFDFGALPDGASIQDRLTKLCEPPPSLPDLQALADASSNGRGEVAHEFQVLHNGSSQRVTTKTGGRTTSDTTRTAAESVFNITLSAECLWVYDKTKMPPELKKQFSANLAVQYTGKDGMVREVKYSTQDPQMGWVMS